MKKISLILFVSAAAFLFSSLAQSGPPSRWGGDVESSPRQKATEEVSPELTPVETPGGTVLSPRPTAPAPQYAEPERYEGVGSPRIKSDLPAGWEEPVRVPAGAIPLERVGGRPMAPKETQVVTPAPPEEFVTEGWQEPPKRPPSRWGQ